MHVYRTYMYILLNNGTSDWCYTGKTEWLFLMLFSHPHDRVWHTFVWSWTSDNLIRYTSWKRLALRIYMLLDRRIVQRLLIIWPWHKKNNKTIHSPWHIASPSLWVPQWPCECVVIRSAVSVDVSRHFRVRPSRQRGRYCRASSRAADDRSGWPARRPIEDKTYDMLFYIVWSNLVILQYAFSNQNQLLCSGQCASVYFCEADDRNGWLTRRPENKETYIDILISKSRIRYKNKVLTLINGAFSGSLRLRLRNSNSAGADAKCR